MRAAGQWVGCAVLLLVLCGGCAVKSTASNAAKHQGVGRVYDKENGFSIIMPANWISGHRVPPAFMHWYDQPRFGFYTNVNISAKPYRGPAVDAYSAQLKTELSNSFPGYSFVDERFIQVDNKKVYCLTGTLEVQVVPLQFLQCFVRGENERLYTITFTALQSEFDGLRKVFENCVLTARTD